MLLARPIIAEGLAERCWTPADLAGRAEEIAPRRGAPGNARSIPDLGLGAFQVVPKHLRGSIRRVALPPGRKLVALTFDMCEQPGEIAGYDGRIVDLLRARGLKATFFVGGKWMLTHAERAQQLMATGGFELASHGWVHRNVRGLVGAGLEAEIMGPSRAYERLRQMLAARHCVAGRAETAMSRVPVRLGLYRFPYGACNDAALERLAANGLLAVQWDVSSGDAGPGLSAQAIASHVARSVRPGSIVLMHANGRGPNTAAALPRLLEMLAAKGFELVTVSELLEVGRPEIAATCYDARPGDTDRYDRLFMERARTEPRAPDGFSTETRRGK
jgi:peptidoglycan/xylan/chitin deacetylase (PgdA/CDA1 family)